MKQTGLPLLLLTIIPFFAFLTGCDFNTAEEKEFNRQLDNITLEKQVRFSDLEMLQSFTRVCILRPYAIRASGQEQSLEKLFPNINYGPMKNEIFNAANDDAKWSIYLINGQNIEGRLSIKSRSIKSDVPFESGCYAPERVCLKKLQEQKSVFVNLSVCN